MKTHTVTVVATYMQTIEVETDSTDMDEIKDLAEQEFDLLRAECDSMESFIEKPEKRQ